MKKIKGNKERPKIPRDGDTGEDACILERSSGDLFLRKFHLFSFLSSYPQVLARFSHIYIYRGLKIPHWGIREIGSEKTPS